MGALDHKLKTAVLRFNWEVFLQSKGKQEEWNKKKKKIY